MEMNRIKVIAVRIGRSSTIFHWFRVGFSKNNHILTLAHVGKSIVFTYDYMNDVNRISQLFTLFYMKYQHDFYSFQRNYPEAKPSTEGKMKVSLFLVYFLQLPYILIISTFISLSTSSVAMLDTSSL